MSKTKLWHQLVDWTEVCGQGHSFNVAIVSITPDMAAAMLDGSSNYRRRDISRTAKYSSVMAEGEWEVNADTIKFDGNYSNIDGHHRLRACVDSGAAFVSLVVVGVESVSETDRGKPRNLSDALSHAGEKNSVEMSAVIRWAWTYEKSMRVAGAGIDVSPTCSEALQFLEEYPEIRDFRAIGARLKSIKGTRSTSISACLFHGCKEAKQPISMAEMFIEGIVNGVEGNFTDPRHQLHKRLISNSSSKAKLLPKDIIGSCIKAWNFFILGRSANASSIVWKVTEDFPKFVTFDELHKAGAV